MDGKKTYIAAIGLLCGAIYTAITLKDYGNVSVLFLNALGLFGLRSAVAKLTE